jgi:hypothetical protein
VIQTHACYLGSLTAMGSLVVGVCYGGSLLTNLGPGEGQVVVQWGKASGDYSVVSL